MPTARVFVPQVVLESWLTDGRAKLDNDTLTLDGQRFESRGAVRFLAEVAGGGDTPSLVGRVKSSAQLEELGAEHSGESVLLGDNAYQVVEGYALSPLFDGDASDPYPRIVKLFTQP
jgi:hypothetical protein